MPYFYLQIFDQTYAQARKRAMAGTGLDVSMFPTTSPYTTEQVMDETFLAE